MFVLLTLVAYFTCIVLLNIAFFNIRWWPIYAVLIVLTGLYPGMFFARMAAVYSSRTLFLWENNGFIVGLVVSSLLFMLLGHVILWGVPIALASPIYLLGEPQLEMRQNEVSL